jgi:anaerobic magnesium-protoporphyrin IX monomethyl ester cyclase
MRVTLIDPPRFLEFAPSLGLFYVAGVLERAGHEVAIVDKPINSSDGKTWETFNATVRQMLNEVTLTKPELIGMTATCHTFYGIELLNLFRKILPGIKTVVGGPQITFIANDVLSNYGSVDFVVRGEGEYTMLKLVKALEEDQDLAMIDGLSYRRDGKIVNNPDAPLIENLDELPYPARHLADLEQYPEDTRITLASSRGCPHSCIFCSSTQMWRKYRTRSVQKVLEELAFLKREYSPKKVNFVDDTFAVGKDRTISLCQGMRQNGLDLVWSAMTRVGLGRQLLEEMYSAGCRFLYFGCESGDDSILSTVTKGITTSQIENTVTTALKIGFYVTCSFVINLPFETPQNAERTIVFARKLKEKGAHIQGHMLAPYPGTEIYNNLDKYNVRLKHQGMELWKAMSHPLYMEDRPPRPLLSNNLISEQELTELWAKATSVFEFY